MNEQHFIPEQYKGEQKDFEHRIVFSSLSTAKSVFDKAKYRLLEINKWHEYGGLISADFTLTDATGNTVERLANIGDYIKIDIPGPSHPGGQHDWVKVEDIRYEMPDNKNEMMFLKLQPASAPNETRTEKPMHFFEEESSSSFILKREDHEIIISYHGRNEVKNTDTEQPLENARNWLIGLSAMLGFSDLQWKSLIRGIITVEE